MTMNAMLKLAKLHLIFDSAVTKAATVRAIQDFEGGVACFATGRECDGEDEKCCWREDCLREAASRPSRPRLSSAAGN